MKTIDLSKQLNKYKKGWVAVDQKKQSVVASSNTFRGILTSVKKNKDLILLPAANNYFGFIT